MIRFKDKKPRQRQPSISYDKNRSYTYRSRSNEPSGNKNRKKSQETNNRLSEFLRSTVFIGTTVAILIAIGYATVLGTDANVKYEYNQQAPREIGEYEKKANEILGQSLNNRWKLSIQKDDIQNSLKQDFPEISSVDILTPPWAYQPVFKFSFYDPQLVLKSTGNKFLVNDEGVAMLDVSNSSATYDLESLPKLTDQTSYEVKTGKHILSSDQIGFINEIIFQANQKKLKVNNILLKPGGEEVHFRFKGLEYLVKFSFDNDARKSAGAFLALKKHLDSKGQQPEEYIDARVAERAYVR